MMADGLTPGAAAPDGSRPDGGMSDARTPAGRTPDGGMSDARTSAGRTPDGGMSDARTPAGRTPDVLTLTGLSWSVGGSAILSGVDLAVGAGEFVAVIGPNGAGKTSLFNVISGLNRATGRHRGRIALDGADITTEAPHKRARRGIGRT